MGALFVPGQLGGLTSLAIHRSGQRPAVARLRFAPPAIRPQPFRRRAARERCGRARAHGTFKLCRPGRNLFHARGLMPRGRDKRTRIMHKPLAFVMSVIVAGGVLATATAAGAQVRYLGPERVYPMPPPGGPGYRETPIYFPVTPPPPNSTHPGFPAFQSGSRRLL